MIFIGIDPPKGFAIWGGQSKRFYEIGTTDFWGLIEIIKENNLTQEINVIIEAPQMNKPTFYRPGQNNRAMSRISQNVGANKETSILIIEYCKRNGIICEAVPPLRGELKRWKKDRALFSRMTGWTKSTSEHGRDAAALVWQR